MMAEHDDDENWRWRTGPLTPASRDLRHRRGAGRPAAPTLPGLGLNCNGSRRPAPTTRSSRIERSRSCSTVLTVIPAQRADPVASSLTRGVARALRTALGPADHARSTATTPASTDSSAACCANLVAKGFDVRLALDDDPKNHAMYVSEDVPLHLHPLRLLPLRAGPAPPDRRRGARPSRCSPAHRRRRRRLPLRPRPRGRRPSHAPPPCRGRRSTGQPGQPTLHSDSAGVETV